MSLSKTEKLVDVNGTEIVSMGASWTSKPYSMAEFMHLGLHLVWDNNAPTGTLTIEYHGDVGGLLGTDLDPNGWIEKNTITLDGSFSKLMVLDANLPITYVRLKFVWTANTAVLKGFVNRKKAA